MNIWSQLEDSCGGEAWITDEPSVTWALDRGWLVPRGFTPSCACARSQGGPCVSGAVAPGFLTMTVSRETSTSEPVLSKLRFAACLVMSSWPNQVSGKAQVLVREDCRGCGCMEMPLLELASQDMYIKYAVFLYEQEQNMLSCTWVFSRKLVM